MVTPRGAERVWSPPSFCRVRPLLWAALLLLSGCPSPQDDDDSAPTPVPLPAEVPVLVTVTLDGAPVEGATVSQGGADGRWATEADGTVTITLDRTVEGEHWVIAAHPEARTNAVEVDAANPGAPQTVGLLSFETVDNPDYVFKDPGEPDRRDTTAQCAHCHLTLSADFVGSKHREAAKDPQVQDVYAGVAGAHDEGACEDAGGSWLVGPLPAGGSAERCFLGDGVLPALNGCGPGPCATATAFGACADCHAPGIDGALGGRDLRDASGHAYEYGVHCDVCHRVESVDLTAPAGVAGALRLLRPSPPGAFNFPERPLTFGPYDDVPQGVMGGVARDHFGDARLCAGCHELNQDVLVPGSAADLSRWPDGRLPIHSTYSEWLAGPLSPEVPCSACHMPPAPDVGNAADLTLLGLEPGFVTGWWRAPGAVRHHTFDGPQDGVGPLLRLAASLDLTTTLTAGTLTATATVRNVGAGHAIPTGEPMRSLLVLVEARCAEDVLAPTSGFALSDVGGELDRQEAGADWSLWPGAALGDVVRVVAHTGAFHDEPGPGPFGDGRFDAAQKGMPVEVVVGQARIVGLDGGVATFDAPLPAGDAAIRGEAADLAPGSPAEALAGSAGHAFARVLAGADGRRQVPHFLAVDVVSDNRLPPTVAWTGAWTFSAPCAAPVATATLLYRSWPLALARERGWGPTDVVVAQAVR